MELHKNEEIKIQEIIIDTECYINYFLLNFINKTTKKQGSFEIDENNNQIEDIVAFMKQENVIFIGHNLMGYDNILLNYIIKYINSLNFEKSLIICKKLKDISDLIINRKRNEKWDIKLKDLITTKTFNFIDTLAIMNTIDRVGIKQASVNLKYNNVQDLPYEPNRILSFDERQEVKKYCFNDCNISLLLYESKLKDLELRKDVTERYGLNVMNSNDTAIAKKILTKYYSEYTRLPELDFKDLRSYNKPFFLEEIMPKITFKTKPFQDLYEWFKVQEITEKTEIALDSEIEEKKVKISYDLKLPNIISKFALGGVHSIDPPGNFKSTKDYDIIDCDFSSWYPYLLLNYAIKPRHVKSEFLNIVRTLTEERIADKKAGRKNDANVKKIIINSIYGLLNSDYYWLKDKKALLKVTITGQLWLAKFLEELTLANFNVISMNTDGILTIVPHNKKNEYLEICENISKAVKVGVEYTYYKQYIRKDVNNYISILKDSPNNVNYEKLLELELLKQKGKYFSTKIQLSKGYYYPIIAKALNKYYVEGIDVETTIKKETDIYLFICSQKVDTNKYTPELHYYNDKWELCKDKLQKINRWVVTKNGKKFLKVELDKAKEIRLEKKKLSNKKITEKDKQNKQIGVEVNNFVTIVNNIIDDNAQNYNIDYEFYITLCKNVIFDIDPPIEQLSLF